MITLLDIEAASSSFLAYMEEVDRRLREARTAIPSRPLLAFRELAKDGLTLPIGGPNEHTKRVHEWFERRYGDRLLLDFSIGKAVVLIRGDPYVMRLPLVFGTWNGVIDVTKTYVGMTKELFADLAERDRTAMVTAFGWFLERFQNLSNLPPLITANIDTAILQMTAQMPHYGESKWASLQAAEKTLKELIKRRKVDPPHIHNLTKLLRKAEGLGLPPGYWPMLALIQCDAGVRYDNNVSLDQAAIAHHASIDLCAFIAQHIDAKERTAPANDSSDIGDLVVSFGHAIAENNDGGLLFRFVMCDGDVRRLLFGANMCFGLTDMLRKSLASGRHLDERKDLLGKRDFRNIPPRHPVRLFLANEPSITQQEFEESILQAKGCAVNDFSNGVEFDFEVVGGPRVRMLMGSTVVNYFVDALAGGIEAGREHGLFARPLAQSV